MKKRNTTCESPPMTREQALAMRRTRYMPLKRCANGHLSARYTKTNRCIACQNDSDNRHILPRTALLMGDRDEARGAGRRLWMPDYLCESGHLAPRRTSSNRCTECEKIARANRTNNRKWVRIRIAHPSLEGPLRVYADKLNVLMGGLVSQDDV